MESASEDDDEESEHESGSDAQTKFDLNEQELDQLRQQVDNEVKYLEETPTDHKKAINFNIQNYIASMSQNNFIDDNEEVDVFEDAIDNDEAVIPATSNPTTDQHETNVPQKSNEELTEHVNNLRLSDHSDAESVDDDTLPDLDPTSREYRLKMVEKLLSDARSQRSYSTSASTIASSVVKDRIKKVIDVKEKQDIRKRCIAKGEASAVTRIRKENRDTCKQYAGWDF